MTRFALLAALALLTACTARTPVASMRLGDSPALAGGTFSAPGSLSVAATVREIGGRTGICGVWSESDVVSALVKGRTRNALGPSAVMLGNEAVVSGLYFLRKVPARPAGDYGGIEADCVVTDRVWTASDATKPVRIHMPRQVVYQDIDEQGIFEVVFRPGGPSAHADDPKPWD